VPRAGDWYAHNMCLCGSAIQAPPGARRPPSKSGYKDIIPFWKAEKFAPEALMALYKKAGARYFVSMGVQHDNFNLGDSRHHK